MVSLMRVVHHFRYAIAALPLLLSAAFCMDKGLKGRVMYGI